MLGEKIYVLGELGEKLISLNVRTFRLDLRLKLRLVGKTDKESIIFSRL